jgi:branched-chain amino acid transport system substrate-binding protein
MQKKFFAIILNLVFKETDMKTSKSKLIALIVTQLVLVTTGLFFVFKPIPPNTFKVQIVTDSNKSETIRALNLYKKRFNKYGGIDNTEMRFIYNNSYTENNSTIGTLDLTKSILIVNNKHYKINKKVNLKHMNYRMSAVANDAIRQGMKPITPKALTKVKGLDVLIESLPTRLGSPKEIREKLEKKIGENYYFKKLKFGQLVHTGIAMNCISDIDLDRLTYTMDFFLWFRWDGNESLPVDSIEFVNTVHPSLLIDDNTTTSLKKVTKVEQKKEGNSNYIKYHVVGRFHALEHKNYALGEQNLPIRFRHQRLPIEDLYYVRDYSDCSMGLYNQNKPTSISEWGNLKFNVVDEDSLSLNYTLSYSTFSNKIAIGDPVDLLGEKLMSEFTMRYAIKSVLMSVRGIEGKINSFFPLGEGRIDLSSMSAYLLISLALSLGLSYIRRHRILKEGWSHAVWTLNLGIVFAVLLCSEFVLSQLLSNLKASAWGADNIEVLDSLMTHVQTVISILWWITPAYYITSALDEFLWCPIEEKTGNPVPHVLKMFTNILIYALALIGILAYIFEVTTNSLMATSGAFAILFAILSKLDISNIIAGLGVSFAKLFKLDDWVKINGVEGKVVEMTPRSTKILTVDNSIINIPNAEVGEAIIENMAHPTGAYRLKIHLEIVPMDYRFVEDKLLIAVANTKGVLTDPKPFVAFLGQGDSAQIFEVYFYINDYSKKAYFTQAVWREVWSICEEFGILMSTPQREHLIRYLN